MTSHFCNREELVTTAKSATSGTDVDMTLYNLLKWKTMKDMVQKMGKQKLHESSYNSQSLKTPINTKLYRKNIVGDGLNQEGNYIDHLNIVYVHH